MFKSIFRLQPDVYRILHVGHTDALYNEGFRQHREKFAKCNGEIVLDIDHERQWGLTWIQRVKCTKCTYLSKFHKLYTETDVGRRRRGRKAASLNTSVQIGLSKTPIGGESLRLLCMSADLPPPSSSGLQRAANRVADQIGEENVKDMKMRRGEIRSINKYRGVSEKSLSLSSDGMYNNRLSSGLGNTPFQPATQVTYVATENQTADHQVLNLVTRSKLCSKHHLTDNSSCIEDPNCTANLRMSESIGNEKKLAEECFRDLTKDQLEVQFITTDADSAAHSAAADMFRDGELGQRPENFLDTRHLSASHRRHIKSSNYVLNMMPASTKKEKQALANKFSLDLAARCQAEFSAGYTYQAGNVTKLKKSLSYCSTAISFCYTGNHSKCKKASYVCKGSNADNWLVKSKFLDRNFQIKRSKENSQTLLQCAEFRLGCNVVDKTKFNLNTQKCEAVNKAMRRSLPRDTTFSRNFHGRAHSAVHTVNAGSSARSVARLRQSLGCGVSKHSKIDKALRKTHQKTLQCKRYKQTAISKERRGQKKLELFKLHTKQETHYSKDILLKK